MRKYVAIGTACAALAMAGCDGGKVIKAVKAPASVESISAKGLESLSGKKIFFGHQSVGWNIIDGLKDIAREKGRAGFNFVETRTPGDAPGLYHAAIGQNGDPLGKIKDFEAIMRGGMGDKVDIALMKLCYVDFDGKTNAQGIFEAYASELSKLEAEYPRVVFVRATAPLTTDESGIKSLVKSILGKSTAAQANASRERFNELVRADCARSGKPLLDIALAEAASDDGTVNERNAGGRRYISLRDDYSSDGGHLNEAGRKVVAARFLAVLAGAD
jgi:hypothetical protein